MQKSLVLLSAGLDSTLSLLKAKEESTVKIALTFDYGQRARQKETGQAAKIASHLGIAHQVIKLSFFQGFTYNALTNKDLKLPEIKAEDLDNLDVTQETAKAVWVPNRNGIFLNIAAGIAETNGYSFMYVGFNAEEAATFPDNSKIVKFTRNIWP